jgi:hypothetical protein
MSWLEDRMNEFDDNTYFLIDCPGQLELYSHYNIIKTLTNHFKKHGVNICSVFCLDSTFLTEQSKFVSGCLLSLATMIQMELPHLTVLTKVDLIEDKSILDKMDELDPRSLISEINPFMGKNMEKLSKTLVDLVFLYNIFRLITIHWLTFILLTSMMRILSMLYYTRLIVYSNIMITRNLKKRITQRMWKWMPKMWTMVILNSI